MEHDAARKDGGHDAADSSVLILDEYLTLELWKRPAVRQWPLRYLIKALVVVVVGRQRRKGEQESCSGPYHGLNRRCDLCIPRSMRLVVMISMPIRTDGRW